MGVFLAWILVWQFFCVEGRKVMDSPSCDFPAIYNFGDSNSDTGGISAAFYPVASPCGETFFHKPAGRASDGRLIIDFIAKYLKLPYLSAYLDSLGTSFRRGANFATGGSTILHQNESISENGLSPFSLDIQIAQFSQFKARTNILYNQGVFMHALHTNSILCTLLQPYHSRAEICFDSFMISAHSQSSRKKLPKPEDFAKALYTFDLGQNDIAAGIRKMTVEQFQALIPEIVNHFARAIQELYQQGARAFWIHNTGPIGCLAVTLHYLHNPVSSYVDRHGCVKDQNEMAIDFNKQLKNTVIKLRADLPEATFTYVDIFAAKYKLISNAHKLGFQDKAEICCGYHEESDHIWCGNKGIINGTEIYAVSCKDPSNLISWDGVHYTEAANHWVANHIINGSFTDPSAPITQSCPWLQSK